MIGPKRIFQAVVLTIALAPSVVAAFLFGLPWVWAVVIGVALASLVAVGLSVGWFENSSR
jgi:hypothetical protein